MLLSLLNKSVEKSNKTWNGPLVIYESLLLIQLDPDNSVPLTRILYFHWSLLILIQVIVTLIHWKK